MSPKALFRLGAIGFATLVILVAMIQASRHPVSSPPNMTTASRAPMLADDKAVLARCQHLGAAGTEDPECLAAWRAARSRFLGVAAKEAR